MFLIFPGSRRIGLQLTPPDETQLDTGHVACRIGAGGVNWPMLGLQGAPIKKQSLRKKLLSQLL